MFKIQQICQPANLQMTKGSLERSRRTGQSAAGWTLVEVLIVVIIISIVMTLAIPNYTKFAERSNMVEAKKILGIIRMAQLAYYELNGAVLNVGLSGLGLGDLPTNWNCDSEHYFTYGVADDYAYASRCSGYQGDSGKYPDFPAEQDYEYAYDIKLWRNGTFSIWCYGIGQADCPKKVML